MPFIDRVARLSRRFVGLRVRGALAQKLYNSVGASNPGTWHIDMHRGFTLTLPKSSAMTWMPAFTGFYDDEEMTLIASFATPGSFVLDVGASFGFYALTLSSMLADRDVDIVAVEPLPANLVHLRQNLAANHKDDKIKIVPIALGRAPGEVQLVAVEGGGCGNAFAQPVDVDAPDAGVRMRIEMLDSLDMRRWTDKQSCSVIKMDVEGRDLDVLIGAESFIARHRPVIFGEFNPYFMQRLGVDPNSVQTWAAEHDMRCYEVILKRASRFTDHKAVSLRFLGKGKSRGGGNLLLVPPGAETRASTGLPPIEPSS